MSPQLTPRNAQVSTAAVEINILTVSREQVSPALFRQLIEEPLVAEDGNLNGVPWGTVNYHPGDCDQDPPHWHVVWQLGDELRRSQVGTTYKPRPVFWSHTGAHHHAAKIYHWLATGAPPGQDGVFNLFRQKNPSLRSSWVNNYQEVTFLDEETGIETGFHIPQEVRTALWAMSDLVRVHETWEHAKEQAAAAEQSLEAVRQDLSAFRRTSAAVKAHLCILGESLKDATVKLEEYSPDSAKEQQAQDELSAALTVLRERYATETLDPLWTAYRRELEDEANLRQRQMNARKTIADLPQLFIGPRLRRTR